MNVHEIVRKDIQAIVDDNLPYDNLRGTTIVVPGGTGQLGRAFIQTLLALNTAHRLNLDIVIVTRKPECVNKDLYGTERISCFTMKRLLTSGFLSQHIVHFACPTDNHGFVRYPFTTMRDMVLTTNDVIQLAKFSGAHILYVSSMEVYGKTNKEDVTEKDLGVLDRTKPRSSYPEGKRFCESLLLAAADEFELDTRIVRPTLTFGSAIEENDTRVYAQFIRSAMAKSDIVIKASGKAKRDYCYIYDFVRSLLIVMLLGKNKEVYNISNPQTYCSVLDLAREVQKFSPESKIVFAKDDTVYPPDVHIRLNTKKIDALHRFQKVGLKDILFKAITLTQSRDCS